MQSEFESLFQESIKDIDMTPGSIVNATVIDIKEDFIYIDLYPNLSLNLKYNDFISTIFPQTSSKLGASKKILNLNSQLEQKIKS